MGSWEVGKLGRVFCRYNQKVSLTEDVQETPSRERRSSHLGLPVINYDLKLLDTAVELFRLVRNDWGRFLYGYYPVCLADATLALAKR